MNHGLLYNAIIYLAAAVIAVPLTKWLGLGSVIGYLLSGLVIGPHGLGLISSTEDIFHFSEFGVVLLLFLIGLELNPHRLWQLRKYIFGMGSAQVLLCLFGFWIFGLTMGVSSKTALVAAMGFAMSSTALALQVLRERNLQQAPIGQASFAVLLFQDLAVIPLLAVLPLLASSEQGAISSMAIPITKALGAIVVVIAAGRFLVRPAFRLVARTNLREIFTAFSLLLVLGISFLMQSVGLSMGLGAFLAGVLLADSEFRHELEVDIEPFKGLLLGLFFIAVGMSMNVMTFINSPFQIMGLVICLLALKSALLLVVTRSFGYSLREGVIFSLALSQGGEFAFVLFGAAAQQKIITLSDFGKLNIVVALSMAATPFLFIFYEKILLPRMASNHRDLAEKYAVQPSQNPVILAGYGRIGQVVGRLLHAQGIGVTILEQDPSQIEVVHKFGWKAFYGDITRLDLLEAAGAREAQLLVIAIDDMDAAQRTVDLAREHFPNLKILVRAESRLDAYHFINQEVPVVRATFAPGLEMAERALGLLGYPAYEARVVAQRFKRYDKVQLLRSAQHISDEKTLISISKENRDELTRIMETDDRKRNEISGDGWG